MKIIENNYEDQVFPTHVKCEHCGSILELEREDCERTYNKFTAWYEYYFTCPCCKQESKFEDAL